MLEETYVFPLLNMTKCMHVSKYHLICYLSSTCSFMSVYNSIFNNPKLSESFYSTIVFNNLIISLAVFKNKPLL